MVAPPPREKKICPPEPVHMTLLGNRDFANVIKLMISDEIIQD